MLEVGIVIRVGCYLAHWDVNGYRYVLRKYDNKKRSECHVEKSDVELVDFITEFEKVVKRNVIN
jgi:hypothetical protein